MLERLRLEGACRNGVRMASTFGGSQPSFESMARQVLGDLQASLAELIECLPQPIRRAVDLERALGVEKKLAWQAFRLSRRHDLRETANVPSLVSARRLIEAARQRGVNARVLTRVQEAFDRFEEFATVHGDGRAGLVSMMSTLTGGVDEQFELNVRRNLFRAQAHVWGVHARLAVRTNIIVPRIGSDWPRPGEEWTSDLVAVVGDLDMVRRRQSDPLVMLRWLDTMRDMEQRAKAGVAGGALDAATGGRFELLPQFSSDPLPQMTRRQTKQGPVETDMVFPPGRTGAVTIYCAEFREAVHRAHETFFASGTFVTMPMETLVREILTPAGWSDPATARVQVYARRHHPEQVMEERAVDLLPQRERLEYLGVHESPPPLGDAPNHAAAVRHALEQRGWLGRRFDVYRCRVEYPIMYSLVMARVDRSEGPPGA